MRRPVVEHEGLSIEQWWLEAQPYYLKVVIRKGRIIRASMMHIDLNRVHHIMQSWSAVDE